MSQGGSSSTEGKQVNERTAESRLATLWQSGTLRGSDLTAADGRRLRVLHPGLGGNGKGPDFCGAAIAWLDGGRSHGDVELHTDSRLWRRHGHHRDPGFNGVVLHVVFHHESKHSGDHRNLTRLQDGTYVPIVPLEACLENGLPVKPPVPPLCRSLSGIPNLLEQALLRAGEQRFRLKAAGFSQEMARSSPGQALYSGIMDALGYARNRAPCRELAQRVPLQQLEQCSSRVEREALLLGAAGLLPFQTFSGPFGRWPSPPPADLEELVQAWEVLGACLPIETMVANHWEFFHIRPSNSPVRRLAAMASLAGKWPDGLLAGALELAARAAQSGAAKSLAAGLEVAGDGYWANHWHFGKPCRPAALVGHVRALDIAVNVLLPLTFAWSCNDGRLTLGRSVLDLYYEHPPLSENRVTRYMATQVWGSASPGQRRVRLNACQQQGLIHVFRMFCSHGSCTECPLGTMPSA